MKKIGKVLKKLCIGVLVVVGSIVVVVLASLLYPTSYVLMFLFQIPYVIFKGINTVTGTFWHSLSEAFKESTESKKKKQPSAIHEVAGTTSIH